MNRKTHSAAANWEITVATAAPATPRPSAKMNTGSRAKLMTTPSTVVIIPVRGNPSALIKGVSPVANIENAVPIK